MRHIVIALATLTLIACNLLTTAPSDATAIPNQPIVQATSTTTPLTFAGQEIRDERAGFVVNVPADWYIFPFGDTSDAIGYSATAQSLEPTFGGGEVPDGESKVDINVETPAVGNWTLDSIEAELHAQNSDGTIERITLDTGVEAIRTTTTGIRGNSFGIVYTVFNQHRVAIVVLVEELYISQD
ncbi:MAG: hypothetical protein AAFV93_13015, partial [Chloroflexota bacterium]